MKTLFVLAAMALLLSCSEKEVSKETIPYGYGHQWEAIRKDIESQYASLSFEDKLELCLLDFSFESAQDYNDMLEHPPDDVKATLLKNDVFLNICERRRIDPNDIPDDYFSPYK